MLKLLFGDAIHIYCCVYIYYCQSILFSIMTKNLWFRNYSSLPNIRVSYISPGFLKSWEAVCDSGLGSLLSTEQWCRGRGMELFTFSIKPSGILPRIVNFEVTLPL